MAPPRVPKIIAGTMAATIALTAGAAIAADLDARRETLMAENRKDLAEIPKNVKDKLDIQPVKWIDQVLETCERLHEQKGDGGPSPCDA